MSEASDKGGEAKKPDDRAPERQRVSLFGGRSRPPEQPEKPPLKRRRRLGLSSFSGFLSFALFGAVCGLGLFAWAMMEARRPGPLAADKVVVIAREDDGGPIGDQLERAGVIDNSLWFAAMTLIDGSRGALKRGEYAFKAGVSLREVEAELVAHKVVLHSITIPEGLTSDQIVERVRDNDVLVGDVKETPREGTLLPETYKFALGETREAILTVMAKAQAKTVDEIWKNRTADLPIKSPGELVTLASIVEKETGKPDERARVAGVFVNRLRRHMKLESDPTIVYGLVFGRGTLGHPISKAELEQSTPYNTYVISGLPPGPICNPGKAALEAVANPASTNEVYFVADGAGGHAFAETLDQHLKNVAHWRQIEKDAKDRLAPRRRADAGGDASSQARRARAAQSGELRRAGVRRRAERRRRRSARRQARQARREPPPARRAPRRRRRAVGAQHQRQDARRPRRGGYRRQRRARGRRLRDGRRPRRDARSGRLRAAVADRARRAEGAHRALRRARRRPRRRAADPPSHPRLRRLRGDAARPAAQ